MAQTNLSVELGFEGRLTPGHYAPIRIEVTDYQSTEPARLRITQRAGNEWRGEATLQQELDYAIQSNGRYEAVIPIYDPVNPITIELLSPANDVLATETVNHRATMRPVPYPILDKQLPRFDSHAAVVDVASLPAQWWGYDAAESLWVASPLPSETWTAISQWVLAGGSLVLLTGTDFYRMDSPQFRELLPVASPEIRTTPLGTAYLSGSPAKATIDQLSEEGFPLLLHTPYGAGTVSMISVHVQSLSVEELQSLSAHVPPTELLTLGGATQSILGSETVVTLSLLLLLGMIVLLGILACVCAVIGRRNEGLGWSILLVCVIAIAVWSGLSSNPASHVVDIYTINTNVYVQDMVSYTAVFSSSYSQVSGSFLQEHNKDILPLEFLPRTLGRTNSFDSLTILGETKQMLAAGEMRSWHAYGTAASVFDLQILNASAIRIRNSYPDELGTAWIIVDGFVYPLADVPRGTQEFDLDSAPAVHLSAFLAETYSQRSSAILQMIREVCDVLSLTKGVWFIAATEDSRVVTTNRPQKVRDISLVVVRAEEGKREI